MAVEFIKMGRTGTFVLFLFFVSFLPAMAEETAQPGESVSFSRSEVVIIEAGGQEYKFDVEIASTEAQHSRGLMFRRSLGDKAGMLFVFSPARRVGMWMKNTAVSLDMLFINKEGRITRIAKNTVPFDLAVIDSVQPVAGVLEIKAGSASVLGINEGDEVICEVLRAK